MDLSTLSLNELRRLQSKIDAEIRRRSDITRRELLKKMQKMAAEEGLSLSDIIPGATTDSPATVNKARRSAKGGGKKTGKVPPKYRHPDDSSLTWTGRGRKPLWVENWIATGNPLEALLIQPA